LFIYFFALSRTSPRSTLFPYTTLFRSLDALVLQAAVQQKQKNWTEAQTTLAHANKVSPKDTTVLCMQGLVAIQLGQKDVATEYRSEEHTSELQSRGHLVCRLLLEKKKH